jgi:hypothetical protein
MEISFQDRSNYFKGMLLLMCKEGPVDEHEKNRLRRLGKILDFEPQFCEYIIRHYLDNTFIIKEPAKFSNPEIARIFIRDGIKICFADHTLHVSEIELLYKAAIENKLSGKWFARELYGFLDLTEAEIDDSFEIARFFKIKYEFDLNVFGKRFQDHPEPVRLQSNL